MARHLTRLWWRLLALAFAAVLVAGAFVIGFELGLTRGNAMAEPAIAALMEERGALIGEANALRDEVSKLRQESSVLERSRQIERETNKALQAQLKDAQDERLALLKEGIYLKRLIREGGKGAVSVHDLVLSAGEKPGDVRYSFVVTQLIPDFGETKGRVSLGVAGLLDGKERMLSLEELPGASPKELAMQFDQMQSFRGELTLPEGFVPGSLKVTITPEGDRLTGNSETFPWVLADPRR
jgi:hypothetical protein